MLSTRINFTKQCLENIMPREKVFYVFDEKTFGLQLAIYPSGRRTYCLYRRVNGAPKRIRIGDYKAITIENARREATRLNGLIATGDDPQEKKIKERKEPTFSDLFNIYFNEYAIAETKRPYDNKAILELHFLPKWGNRKAKEITLEILRNVHASVRSTCLKKSHDRFKGKGLPPENVKSNTGKAIANKVINLVSSVYNYSKSFGHYTGENPCVGLKKFSLPPRDRFLSNEELRLFLEALKLESTLFHDFFLLLLFTGARKTNVLKMKYSQIDFDLKRWRLGSDETKNADVNIVSLSEPVIEILNRRKATNDSLTTSTKYVFPGEELNAHLKDPKRSFSRIKKRMEISDVTIHDLRRTFGSYMAISGYSLPQIGKSLNHKDQRSTAIYARLLQDPILEAVNTVSSIILRD
jgi:integrase